MTDILGRIQNLSRPEREDKKVDTSLLEARIAELERQIEVFRTALIRAGWIQV